MNYKGYIISITKNLKGTNGAQYLAKVLNGSDYAFGDSEEDALTILKGKLDAISAFQSIYLRPYEKHELERLIKKIREPRNEAMLRIRLDRRHYIEQDFCGIDSRAIINHSDAIEQILNVSGTTYTLNWLKISPHNDREYYILFDEKYFDTEAKVPSRVMRKLVCRLWLNEVSRQ